MAMGKRIKAVGLASALLAWQVAMVPEVRTAGPCFQEHAAVEPACNAGGRWPWCATEDDATDGTPGAACFWRDPDTGWLWANDGDGHVSR